MKGSSLKFTLVLGILFATPSIFCMEKEQKKTWAAVVKSKGGHQPVKKRIQKYEQDVKNQDTPSNKQVKENFQHLEAAIQKVKKQKPHVEGINKEEDSLNPLTQSICLETEYKNTKKKALTAEEKRLKAEKKEKVVQFEMLAKIINTFNLCIERIPEFERTAQQSNTQHIKTMQETEEKEKKLQEIILQIDQNTPQIEQLTQQLHNLKNSNESLLAEKEQFVDEKEHLLEVGNNCVNEKEAALKQLEKHEERAKEKREEVINKINYIKDQLGDLSLEEKTQLENYLRTIQSSEQTKTIKEKKEQHSLSWWTRWFGNPSKENTAKKETKTQNTTKQEKPAEELEESLAENKTEIATEETKQ